MPFGLIDYEKLGGPDILIAQREGAANCMTTFKLKNNHKLIEQNVCFGVTEIKGDYKIKNDTIFFDNIEYSRGETEFFKYAIIRPSKYDQGKNKFDLIRYKDCNDTAGHELWITKNDLPK